MRVGEGGGGARRDGRRRVWAGAGGGRACAAVAKVAKREGVLKTERDRRGGQLWPYLGARGPPLAEPVVGRTPSEIRGVFDIEHI